MTRPILAAALLAFALGGAACDNQHTDDTDTDTDEFDAFANADLTDPEAVVDFANNVSAPNMYTLAALFGAALEEGDGVCPARSESDGVVTYTGGCTDGDGALWSGSATITHTSPESGVITYDQVGRSETVDCVNGGSVTSHQMFDGIVTIEADGHFDTAMTGAGTTVDEHACTADESTFALEYAGQYVQQTEDADVWNGSGRFGVTGRGKVAATTVDEVRDDRGCGTEAWSGATTMEAGNDVVVITYDGATDCDPESTVTWTLNGNAMGELSGVRCGTAPLTGGLALGLAGLVVVGRRRRRLD